MKKIKQFFEHCKIVLRVVTKPSKEEFKKTAMIAGIGILLIGAIGYLVTLLFSMF